MAFSRLALHNVATDWLTTTLLRKAIDMKNMNAPVSAGQLMGRAGDAHRIGMLRRDGEGHRNGGKAGVRLARQVAADVDVAPAHALQISVNAPLGRSILMPPPVRDARLLLADGRRHRMVDLLVRILNSKHLHLRPQRPPHALCWHACPSKTMLSGMDMSQAVL